MEPKGKAKYIITLTGCDDKTEFVAILRPEQARLVGALSHMSTEFSSNGCQPVLNIEIVQPLLAPEAGAKEALE